MNEKHYTEKLSAFVNHELTQDERQAIAEHLLLCAECRAEHDEIKLGAVLANRLPQTDAPENLWRKIEKSLDESAEKSSSAAIFAFLNPRLLAACLLVFIIFTVGYFVIVRNNSSTETAKNESPKQNVETPQNTVPEQSAILNQNTNQSPEIIPPVQPNADAKPQIAESNIKFLPKISTVERRENLLAQKSLPSWNVETLAGTPRVGNSSTGEKLAVGEFLETDANSRARVEVANIGNVEIAPNSRVKLVETRSTEHRLALERGELKAKILAPPRLFIVDTPSAVAVDLGCEYTLEVDEKGNSRLHVTSGFVALENGRFSAIVPAGAIALTRKGKGVGTPFAEDSSAKLQDALHKFDFENGGDAALQTVISESNIYDSITLWHLLSRVPKAKRSEVFNTLANYVEPPKSVTVEGVLRLDKKMLDAWWKEIEKVWFE